jgi:ribbon-helix-helix CopG family protein
MRKTSVYLADDEAEGLRHLAAVSGKSQADLIREGVRRVIAEEHPKQRVFQSLGKGRGGGRPYRRWRPARVYRKVMGGG